MSSPTRERATCGGCCTRLVDFGVTLGAARILEGINLHVHCGELTAIIGPNGAGKTTLFRAMLGEIPHAGRLSYVRADGQTAFGWPRIGYVPQQLQLDRSAPATVADLFAAALARRPLWTGRSRARQEATRRLLAAVDAADLLERKLGRLSCGQLQRVLLALALQPLPDLLLLDEPIAGVDPAGIELFYRTVSELRMNYDLSILLISHDLAAVARVADRMVFLNRSIICDGRPRDVLSDPRVRQTFGMDFAIPAEAQADGVSHTAWKHREGGA